MALPSQRRHPIGLVDRLRTGTHLGIEKARRDNVNAGELSPLASKRFPKVRDEGLAAIVDGLINGHINNVTTHARGDDQITKALLFEHLSNIFGAVENAINYTPSLAPSLLPRRKHTLPLTDICFRYSSSVCSRRGLEIAIPMYNISDLDNLFGAKSVCTSICNKHINLAKVFGDICNCLLNGIRIRNWAN